MQNNFHPEIAYQSQTQCLDAYARHADVLHAVNAACTAKRRVYDTSCYILLKLFCIRAVN